MWGCGRSAVALAISVLSSVEPASAHEAPRLLFQGAGARDVAAAPDGETLFVAVYETHEVLSIDAASGIVRRRTRVGPGPSALLATNDEVAVLNRAAANIALLDPRDLSLKATLPVSPGTSVIFPMDSRRLGMINPLAGEVYVAELTLATVVATVSILDTIPVGGTQGAGRIAIIGRAPASVCLMDAATFEVLARKELPADPRAIVSTPDGRFIVQMDNALSVLDAGSLETIRSVTLATTGLSSSPEGITCLENGGARSLSQDLSLQDSWTLPKEAVAARRAGPALIAWTPGLGRVWRVDAATGGIVAAPLHVASDLAVETEFAKLAAAPTTPPDAIPPILVPRRVDAAPANEPPPAAAAATLGSGTEPADAAAPEYRLTVRPTRLHLGGFTPYAPRFGDPTGRTFTQELQRAFNLGDDEDSLTSIDFNQDMKDSRFREGADVRWTNQGTGAGLKWEGGVDFKVDRVQVQADRLQTLLHPAELLLEGAVRLERGDSTLDAERIRAFDPRPPVLAGARPLVPSRGEIAVPHPLVPHGHQDARPNAGSPLSAIEIDDLVWAESARSFSAERLEINSASRRSKFIDSQGQAGPLYFSAQSLELRGPGEFLGEDVWVTTCDLPTPHYRIRLSRVETEAGEKLVVSGARLQIGKMNTPLYVPRVTSSLLPGERRLGTELEIGGASSLGAFVNVAQWFRVTPSVELAPRLYATSRKGIGVGLDGQYDYMNDPVSPMYRSRGEFETLYTTEHNGFTHWYHRQELTPDTVLLGQWEQWYDPEVIKDFYRDDYEHRTGPRSFASVAYTRPQYMATASLAPSLHGFTEETRKLPELTFHMFERGLGAGFYGTFDGAAGYYETRPESIGAARTLTVGRLSYDWNVARGFNVLPFVEAEGTYYSNTLGGAGDAIRGTTTVGVTAQARMQRSFAGLGNFTGFKHLILPSATLSFRPDATVAAEETPRFDALDRRPGRFRVESTLDNIVLGKNAATGEIWPVTRLTLYQGNDLDNEAIQSNDYELSLEVRPRPAWGLQAIGELHQVNEQPGLPGEDFSRVLTYIFYDDKLGKNRVNGRLGFAYTESANSVLNQEILYGVGYRISERWSAAFEQRYDIERGELTRQSYWIRHKLHDWEIALGIRARQSNVDIAVQINLVNFPEIGM